MSLKKYKICSQFSTHFVTLCLNALHDDAFERLKPKVFLNFLLEHNEYFFHRNRLRVSFVIVFQFTSILRNYVSDLSEFAREQTNFSTSKRIEYYNSGAGVCVSVDGTIRRLLNWVDGFPFL